MKAIAIDSAVSKLTISAKNDEFSVSTIFDIGMKQSETLLPAIDYVLSKLNITTDDLDYLVLSKGPGSFTGLRIGSATAKGLGLALSIPIIPVPTVDALAYNLYGSDKLICPIMDARRNQVYTGLYEFQKGEENDSVYRMNTIEKQCAVDIAQIVEMINSLGKEAIFLGDGVAVYQEKIAELIKVPYSFAPACCNRQRAACVASLGAVLYAQGILETAAEHAPDYLRPSQAERERAEKGM